MNTRVCRAAQCDLASGAKPGGLGCDVAQRALADDSFGAPVFGNFGTCEPGW